MHKRTIRGKVSPLIRSYYAGFFDGEGCVRISKGYGPTVSRPDRQKWYSLQIDIGQTKDDVLIEIHNFYGGSLYTQQPKKGNPITRWSATGKNANNFLRDIVPFLRQKKERVKIALHFYANRLSLSDEDREMAKQKLSSLNGNKSHHPQRLNEKTPKGEAIV